MDLTPATLERFNAIKEKFQSSDEELMKLLLESFEVMNGDRKVERDNGISTTGQKRDSAYIPFGF